MKQINKKINLIKRTFCGRKKKKSLEAQKEHIKIESWHLQNVLPAVKSCPAVLIQARSACTGPGVA